MSQPPPIVLQFAVKGLDDVQKALKSIADAAAGIQRKSKAAAKAAVDEQQKQAEANAESAVKAAVQSSQNVVKAQQAGANQVKKTLENLDKEVQSNAKAATKALKKELESREQAWDTHFRRLKQQHFNAQRVQESAWTSAQQKLMESRRRHIVQQTSAESKSSVAFRNASLKQVRKDFDDAKAEKKNALFAQLGRMRAEYDAKTDRENEWRAAQDRLMESRRRHIVAEHAKEQREAAREAKKKKAAAAQVPEPTGPAKLKKPASPATEQSRNDAYADREINRALEREARAKEKAAARAAKARADAEEKQRKFIANTTISGAKAGVRTIGDIAGGALDAMGGFTASGAVQNEVRLRGQAGALAASSTGKWASGDILKNARATGIQYGFDPSDVLRAIDEVKKLTGDTQMGMNISPFLAKLANATGSDLGELGSLAGNILAGDPKIDQGSLEKQLRIFTHQGMVGGVEIGDFAKYGGRITAGAQMFGDNIEQNESTLGAFAQIARQQGGAASAAEATLAAQRFGTDTAKKADDLKGMGIDVMNEFGTLKSPEEILLQMLKKTDGHVDQLAGLKLGERANKVLYGAANIYRGNGGGAEGLAAVHREIGKYDGALSDSDVEDRNKQRMAEVDKQIESALSLIHI